MRARCASTGVSSSSSSSLGRRHGRQVFLNERSKLIGTFFLCALFCLAGRARALCFSVASTWSWWPLRALLCGRRRLSTLCPGVARAAHKPKQEEYRPAKALCEPCCAPLRRRRALTFGDRRRAAFERAREHLMIPFFAADQADCNNYFHSSVAKINAWRGEKCCRPQDLAGELKILRPLPARGSKRRSSSSGGGGGGQRTEITSATLVVASAAASNFAAPNSVQPTDRPAACPPAHTHDLVALAPEQLGVAAWCRPRHWRALSGGPREQGAEGSALLLLLVRCTCERATKVRWRICVCSERKFASSPANFQCSPPNLCLAPADSRPLRQAGARRAEWKPCLGPSSSWLGQKFARPLFESAGFC